MRTLKLFEKVDEVGRYRDGVLDGLGLWPEF
jgi:hypothetical protein